MSIKGKALLLEEPPPLMNNASIFTVDEVESCSSSSATSLEREQVPPLLSEMGFSEDQINEALHNCDEAASSEKLIDYLTNKVTMVPPSNKGKEPLVEEQALLPGSYQHFHERQLLIEAGSSSATPTVDSQEQTTLVLYEMGFSEFQVHEALQNCGEGASTEALVNYASNIKEPSNELALTIYSGPKTNLAALLDLGYSSDIARTAVNQCGEDAEVGVLIQYIHDYEKAPPTVRILCDMGYSEEQAIKAVETCGEDMEIDVLVDFMDAHENEYTSDYEDSYDETPDNNQVLRLPKKRAAARLPLEKPTKLPRCIRGDMKGFGAPGCPKPPRFLTEKQKTRPYFYFENVASVPQGAWEEISICFGNISPEFVDSKFFSVARRPRGYLHNLPTEGRFQLPPVPPKTIRELLPETMKFRPVWDTREQLYCVNTRRCPNSKTKMIETALQRGPTEEEIKEIMGICKFWNLVWTGPGVCSPLEPHENEMVLGYPVDHTRGGISMTQRQESLGNAFQVDTVGYHLSVLKREFSSGIRVLSLFSGIGGAEVALHKAGIPLKYVVSVEIVPENRSILERWWAVTKQKGKHRIYGDVRSLSRNTLEALVRDSGGFDLIIGGSPCDNLTGNNRNTRFGLEGEQSKLFYEFPRILAEVRSLMGIS